MPCVYLKCKFYDFGCDEEDQKSCLYLDAFKEVPPDADNRKTVLLTAVHEMLKKQKESFYVLNCLEQTVFYDGADCDGECLLNDIAIELGIDD